MSYNNEPQTTECVAGRQVLVMLHVRTIFQIREFVARPHHMTSRATDKHLQNQPLASLRILPSKFVGVFEPSLETTGRQRLRDAALLPLLIG